MERQKHMSFEDDLFRQFIHVSRYARWLPEFKRREMWMETVDRYMVNVVAPHFHPSNAIYSSLRNAILRQDIMPSMRALMTAGPALDRCHVCAYNCAYLPIDDPRAFDETLYILMCGTGVGFSVERQVIALLPEVAEEFTLSETIIKVSDSKTGWARAFRELISMLFAGSVPQWDVSKVRAAGMPLKTFGGRASGPGPLEDLFRFAITIFRGAAGRRLSSIECHDLMCKIGDVVVVGGVRRSALISLSNPSDERLRDAKTGQWWVDTPYRALANNSAAYTEKPDMARFMREWQSLYESKSGERGIFNRQAAIAKVEGGNREASYEFGTNPCGEIILRPHEFCNLTEVIARHQDTFDTLAIKVELATILGTIQSTLIDFKHLRKVWRNNCAEERLLGVSITGIRDSERLSSWLAKEQLDLLRQIARATNEVYAEKLGVPASAAITCVKPSGTVSQLVDAASGIHDRYAPYYIRRVRADIKDPLTRFMIDAGVPNEPEVNKPDDMVVFSFPCKAPAGAERKDALWQLELWKTYADHWCDHNPSATIMVEEHEWMEVGAWVFRNFDMIAGLTFLPRSTHTYQQAPYEEITKKEYEKMDNAMPAEIKWEGLSEYDGAEMVTGSQELACGGDGICEVVDLV